jgi:hypothetical protein
VSFKTNYIEDSHELPLPGYLDAGGSQDSYFNSIEPRLKVIPKMHGLLQRYWHRAIYCRVGSSRPLFASNRAGFHSDLRPVRNDDERLVLLSEDSLLSFDSNLVEIFDSFPIPTSGVLIRTSKALQGATGATGATGDDNSEYDILIRPSCAILNKDHSWTPWRNVKRSRCHRAAQAR